jgi:uncharacterized membrane-anchored protein
MLVSGDHDRAGRAAQVRAHKFRPALYWATIVASTTFGTTMADIADRSLDIGEPRGNDLVQ